MTQSPGSRSKRNRKIEYSFWAKRFQILRLREYGECLVATFSVFFYTSLEEVMVLRSAYDLWKYDLRKGRRADFQHLRYEDRVDIGREALVFVSIVHFDPSTASAWPGNLFRDALHRNPWHVTDDIRKSRDSRSVEYDILVDLIEYEKASILLRDRDDTLEVGLGMDDSGRIIRIDDEDTCDILIVLDFAFELIQVDTPVPEDIEGISDRLTVVVHRFCSSM